MELLLGTLALFVFGGLATYTIGERRHRTHWWRSERRAIAETDSPFRRDYEAAATREVLVRTRAPKLIRSTALWSIYMGQMAVPGALLGLVGVVFGAGLGLISIPGLILAVRIWRLGYALLRRDHDAEHEARALYRFAIWLNLAMLAIAGVITLFLGVLFIPIAAVVAFYGAISFAHALAMKECAELLAEDRRLRADSARTVERELWMRPVEMPY